MANNEKSETETSMTSSQTQEWIINDFHGSVASKSELKTEIWTINYIDNVKWTFGVLQHILYVFNLCIVIYLNETTVFFFLLIDHNYNLNTTFRLRGLADSFLESEIRYVSLQKGINLSTVFISTHCYDNLINII